MKKLACLLIFLVIIIFSSCVKEDEIKTDSISTSVYNDEISNYLNLLKGESNKVNSPKIEALAKAIDFNSVKIYNLKTTEKLLVADLKSLKGFETSDKTKVIFYVYENKITHSNIVTFNNKVPFENFDKVIRSVLDMEKNKDNYSGKISFYNLFQNITLSDEFENGKLTVNRIALRDTTKRTTGKSNGCTAWYWVTTYASGRVTWEYLYTTCTCEDQTWRMADTVTCGSGGGSSSSTSGPVYPPTPQNTDLFTYIDKDGQIITKKYNGETQTWEFFSISLSEVVINNNPTKYSYLIFQWPQDQQKVVNADIIYTYDGASGNWVGVPTTELNPCDQIKAQASNPAYKAKMDILKGQTGQTKENGYAQSRDGTFTTLTANGSDAVALPRDPNRIGYMHTHIDPYQKTNSDGDLIDVFPIKMFSPEDVRQFLILVVNAQTYGIPISDAYGMMVSSEGTYQLAFTGNVANINVKNSTINWGQSLNDIYANTIIDNGVEKGFLKFLQDKIGIDGIELYKVEDSGNAKITLGSNGEIVPINCN